METRTAFSAPAPRPVYTAPAFEPDYDDMRGVLIGLRDCLVKGKKSDIAIHMIAMIDRVLKGK